MPQKTGVTSPSLSVKQSAATGQGFPFNVKTKNSEKLGGARGVSAGGRMLTDGHGPS